VTLGRIDVEAVLVVFAREVPQRIARISEALAGLELTDGDASAAAVEALGREAHNLRGTAATIQVDGIERAAADLEAAIERLPAAGTAAVVGAAQALLQALKSVDVQLAAADEPQPVPRRAVPDAGPVVLHVEDNLSNLKLVERILARRPAVQLVEAHTAEHGLELARKLAPALVLLDLRLPDLSGDEVLRRLRAHPATSGLRVVIVSAEARPAEAKRLIAQGADDYLVKPIEVEALLDVVDAAVGTAEG
jgi:CheY-like chemotaxis protein